jgi:hypothetical protein
MNDPQIKRRRIILYVAASLGVAAILVAGVLSISTGGSEKPMVAPNLKAPVIVERIPLKPVNGSSAQGLAELVRRETNDGLRVLAVKLPTSKENQVYQLLLVGGEGGEKLLGNEVVSDQRAFIGESKLTADELHSHKYVELRLVTQGEPPTEKTVLRGRIEN